MWEKGENMPDVATSTRLAALGFDLQFLHTGVRLPAEIAPTYTAAARATIAAESDHLAELFVQSYPKQGEAADVPLSSAALTAREAEVVFNYRSTTEEGKAVIESTAAAFGKGRRRRG
jgi:hypothetical protein